MPIFNPPPGWPAPPPGWTPPEGWQPDPSWPPGPAGHVWWLADEPALTPALTPASVAPAPPVAFLPLGPAPQRAPQAYAPEPFAPQSQQLAPQPYASQPYPTQPYAPQPYPTQPYAPGPGRFGTGPTPGGTPAPALGLVPQYTEQERRAGRNGIVLGVVLVVVGLAVTIGGYLVADVGGSFVVFWGPVVFGVVSIVRGALRMSRAPEAALQQALGPGR